ncbi:carbohydrate kinase family protein [Dysosmobacter sp. Phy]
MGKILCVGEMMADLVAYPIGQVLLESDYHPMDSFWVKTGGDAHNNAVDMARLGNDVIYIGRIGNDLFAQNCLNSLRQAGVNTDYVIFSQTAEQAKSLILMGEGGTRTFYQNFGSSAELCFEDIDLNVLDEVSLLQIGGTFHMERFDGDGAVRLLREAKSRGITTSLDVTMDRTGRWNSLLEPYYPYLDYFMPSIEQAVEITKETDFSRMADFLLDRGVKNVIIKAGSDGAYFKNRDESLSCGCYKVPVVDTTGAGDAFVSGFLSARERGFSPEQCMEFATACSAQVIQQVGAAAGLKSFQQVLDFIAQAPKLTIQRV